MATIDESAEPRREGLLASVRRLGDTLLRTLHTRLEILSTEIAEERFNLVRAAVLALGALFCFQAGVFLAVLFFVLAVASEDRLRAIGIAAAVLLLAAAGIALGLWRWLKTRPPMFAASIAELRKDRARLGDGGDRAADGP